MDDEEFIKKSVKAIIELIKDNESCSLDDTIFCKDDLTILAEYFEDDTKYTATSPENINLRGKTVIALHGTKEAINEYRTTNLLCIGSKLIKNKIMKTYRNFPIMPMSTDDEEFIMNAKIAVAGLIEEGEKSGEFIEGELIVSIKDYDTYRECIAEYYNDERPEFRNKRVIIYHGEEEALKGIKPGYSHKGNFITLDDKVAKLYTNFTSRHVLE